MNTLAKGCMGGGEKRMQVEGISDYTLKFRNLLSTPIEGRKIADVVAGSLTVATKGCLIGSKQSCLHCP